MDDNLIIELYWERDEQAIAETGNKYGNYCFSIAYNILSDKEDSEECVNDSYMELWKAIPPQRPVKFKAFLGKITRNLSLNRYFKNTAKKRGGGNIPAVLDELKESAPESYNPENAVDRLVLKDILDMYLGSLKEEQRVIFIKRYWYMEQVSEIALEMGLSESKVKMTLSRLRKKLKEILEKEGIL